MKDILSMYRTDFEVPSTKEIKPWVYVVVTLIIIMMMGFVYRAGQLQIQADCEKVGAFRVDTAGFKCEVIK
jgi:hypothetical protein